MESISPAKRCSNENDRDRISKLPDPILHHILSFLETNDAVRTSKLSRRWRNLWASVRCLIFNEEKFDRREKFFRFVETVLILRNNLDVDTFRLAWNNGYDSQSQSQSQSQRTDTWIRYAVKNNVRVLEISEERFSEVHVPLCIFACQTLEALSLFFMDVYGVTVVKVPDFIALPRLKSLHMKEITFFHDSLEKLISGCPVLEDLKLEYCDFNDHNGFPVDICSQTLKSLTITGDYCYDVPEICIQVPSLESFNYDSQHPEISLEKLSSLENAYIRIFDCADSHEHSSGAIEIIRGLSSAKSLELYGLWMEFDSEELSEFPAFNNLRRLKLSDWRESDNLQTVVRFLQCSPNLEMLSLFEHSRPFRGKASWTLRELSFEFPKLKIVSISCFRDERVLELVKILLASAPNLVRVSICPQ